MIPILDYYHKHTLKGGAMKLATSYESRKEKPNQPFRQTMHQRKSYLQTRCLNFSHVVSTLTAPSLIKKLKTIILHYNFKVEQDIVY